MTTERQKSNARRALYALILAMGAGVSMPTYANKVERKTCNPVARAALKQAIKHINDNLAVIDAVWVKNPTLNRYVKLPTETRTLFKQHAANVRIKCIDENNPAAIYHPISMERAANKKPVLTVNVGAMRNLNHKLCKVVNELAHGLAHMAGVPQGTDIYRDLSADPAKALVGDKYEYACVIKTRDIGTTIEWP